MNKENDIFYDTHCHYFNKDIVSLRILVSFIEIMSENKRKSFSRSRHKNKLQLLKERLKFMRIIMSASSTEIYERQNECYKNDFVSVALMLDIKNSICADDLNLNRKIVKYYKQIMFSIYFLFFLEFLFAFLTLTYSKRKNQIMHLSEIRQLVKDTNFKPHDIKQAIKSAEHESFDIQIKELLELKKNNPNVLLFLGVDPRREGIEELIKEYIVKNKYFHGIKIYAPNGYSPLDNRLLKRNGVYDICAKNSIPIVAHCSFKGFATLSNEIEANGYYYKNKQIQKIENTTLHFDIKVFEKKWVQNRAEVLNHPLLWREVFERYKHTNLKINLAHFGNSDENSNNSTEWQDEIFSILQDFDNAYSDLSCFCNDADIKNFKKTYFNDNVKHKFLYGSDYYLNQLQILDMKEYLDLFKNNFTEEEFILIAKKNPKSFLFS